MTVLTRKILSIAGLSVLGLLTIAETASAPMHALETGADNPESSKFIKSLFAKNRFAIGVGIGRGVESFEPDRRGRRAEGPSTQSDAQKAFSDTWSAASATEFGAGGVGGDYSSSDGAGSAGSSFGWPGGMAGSAGPGIAGPGGGNADGARPKGGDTPVSVPEPLTLPLVIFGLATLGIFRMRGLELARQRGVSSRR